MHMNSNTLSLRLLAFALVLALAPAGAFAQTAADSVAADEMTDDMKDMSMTSEDGGANAEARTQFGAAVEAAQAASQTGSADSYIEAGEQYLKAAEIADASGDTDLKVSAVDVRGNAAKAFVNAGSAYSDADDFGNAAAQFERAATIARDLEDAEMGAKTFYNAGVAYVSAEDYPSAVAALDAAIEMAPDEMNYYYVRGVALRGSGDAEGSEAALVELAERAEAAGDEAMAMKARETVGKGYLSAAYADLQAGQFSSAISGLDKAAPFLAEDDATLNTLYANAYYKLGVSQVKGEQLAAAKRSLQQAQTYGRRAGKDAIVNGAQAQLDYIDQVEAQG